VELVFLSMEAAGIGFFVAAWAASVIWTARDAARRCGHVSLRLGEATLAATDEPCPECTTPLKPEFRCCPACGERIRSSCGDCGAPVRAVWTACPWCTKPLVESDEATALSQVA
jgi:hypothetical protein